MDKLFQFVLDHPQLFEKLLDLANNLVNAAKDHPELMSAIASRIKGDNK